MNDRITGPLSILILACCGACGLDTLGTDCTWSRVARQSSAPKRYEQTLTRAHGGDLLMFGGVDSFEGPLLGDLQRFSSGRWTDTAASGPAPRRAHAAAYHEELKLLLIFGGEAGVSTSDLRDDTWTFDGAAWTDDSGAGPSARVSPSAAYHPDSGLIVLFGGANAEGTPLADTWTWDGTWHGPLDNLTQTPSPRSSHLMALDEDTGHVLLHGGCEAFFCEDPLDDTWLWDGLEWTLLDAGTRPGQSGGAMAYHAGQRAMFRFAGGANYRWTGSTWELVAGANPNEYGRFAAAYSPQAEGIVLFGGSAAPFDASAETWVYSCLP